MGADDVLGEEIPKSEFQMRFRAHLRRYIESSLNPITHLVNKNLTLKALKKALREDESYSFLLIKIKNLEHYQKTHGEIAQEKVCQTLSAIINSTLYKKDFVGHFEKDSFLLITNPAAAERIASFLSFAFDNILNKFYSEDEFLNNFTLDSSDNTQEKKHGLMRLNISCVEKNQNETDFREIINNLSELVEVIDSDDSSKYIIDRARLKGRVDNKQKNSVLIYEKDPALSYLLKNVCELHEIEATIASSIEEFKEIYYSICPKVVLLDWGNKNSSKSLEVAKTISKDNIKLIFSSSYLNKKEILKSGADLYIPKPYEIEDMVRWIKKFLG